jgi:hypothetical protein
MQTNLPLTRTNSCMDPVVVTRWFLLVREPSINESSNQLIRFNSPSYYSKGTLMAVCACTLFEASH